MEFDLATGNRMDTEESSDEPPEFGDDMNKAQLKNAIKEYAEWTIDHYDLDVDLYGIPIEVSKRLKRTAGKVSWQKRDGVVDSIRFAWGAYQEWGWEGEFQSTIRHELIHVWEVQEFGKAGHGRNFKSKADELETTVHCQKFSDHNYEVFCPECEKVAATRFRESKMVRNPGRYNSKCCGASCESRSVR